MTGPSARVKLVACDLKRSARFKETRSVSTPIAFPRRYRAAVLLAGLAGVCSLGVPARSQAQAVKEQPKAERKAKAAPRYSVPPTFSNVPYGKHERQVLDFFKADTREPAPLVVHIHGGGWVNGDK